MLITGFGVAEDLCDVLMSDVVTRVVPHRYHPSNPPHLVLSLFIVVFWFLKASFHVLSKKSLYTSRIASNARSYFENCKYLLDES